VYEYVHEYEYEYVHEYEYEYVHEARSPAIELRHDLRPYLGDGDGLGAWRLRRLRFRLFHRDT
jgi:hypothetical protein